MVLTPERIESLRALGRKPIFLHWVKECRGALIGMAAHFVFMTVVLAPLVRAIVPKPKPKSFLGMSFGSSERDRYRDVMAWVDPIFWLIGWSAVGAWAKSRVRPALAAAKRESADLVAQAEVAAQEGELGRSVMLLRRAEELEPSVRVRAELSGRWRERAMGGMRGAGPTTSPAGASGAVSPSTTTSTSTSTSTSSGELSAIGPGGRIRLVRTLGSGGMGKVYLGEDTMLSRKVAVKELAGLLADDPEGRSRFLQEARALAQISSPRVVQIYDLYQEGQRQFLCMELCEGQDLAGRLKTRGRMPASEAIPIAAQIVEALFAAHRKGIVHRDLKPGNILFDDDGGVKVADFGLARLTDSSLTQQGAVMGTPYYMAPEQAAGKPVDARADLYALGCVLFELLCGRPPYMGSMSEVFAQHVSLAPPPEISALAPETPAPLCDLVSRLLAKDPDARPQSAREVEEALRAAGNERSAIS